MAIWVNMCWDRDIDITLGESTRPEIGTSNDFLLVSYCFFLYYLCIAMIYFQAAYKCACWIYIPGMMELYTGNVEIIFVFVLFMHRHGMVIVNDPDPLPGATTPGGVRKNPVFH